MQKLPILPAEHVSLLMQALTMAVAKQSMSAPDPERQPAPAAPPERVQQAERLLLSGELLISLGHEVNNALQGILGNVQLLQYEPLPPAAEELTESILATGQQLQQLLHSMLGMARGVRQEMRCDVAQVLTNVIGLVTPLARDHKVTIEHRVPPELFVRVSPHQFQQIVLNLLINSLQALSGWGGHIWINTIMSDQQVVITIRDDGPGIPDSIQAQIFEPFFSTKPADVGTGLGLSIARTVAREAGGDLAVTDTRPGHTTFTVRLPRAAAAKKD